MAWQHTADWRTCQMSGQPPCDDTHRTPFCLSIAESKWDWTCSFVDGRHYLPMLWGRIDLFFDPMEALWLVGCIEVFDSFVSNMVHFVYHFLKRFRAGLQLRFLLPFYQSLKRDFTRTHQCQQVRWRNSHCLGRVSLVWLEILQYR